MKKRSLIRIVSLFLVLGLLLPTVTASASAQVQPRYAKIHVLTSELLGISWLGKATCCGSVTVWDPTCNVDLYVHLQQSKDAVNWTTIYTWNTTNNGGYDAFVDTYRYVLPGYYYQVVTVAIVYNSSWAFIESDAATSGILRY